MLLEMKIKYIPLPVPNNLNFHNHRILRNKNNRTTLVKILLEYTSYHQKKLKIKKKQKY